MRANKLPEVTANDRRHKFLIITKLNELIQFTPVVNYVQINDLNELSKAVVLDTIMPPVLSPEQTNTNHLMPISPNHKRTSFQMSNNDSGSMVLPNTSPFEFNPSLSLCLG